MNLTRKEKINVAYLGPKGTFCEQAARKYFSSKKVSFMPVLSISEVFRAVEKGGAKHGVVPIENSLEGSINVTLDLLLESSLMVCSEVELQIKHNLIVKPGANMSMIQFVLSHPQALAQCRKFLKKNLPVSETKEVSSTAKAVEMLKKRDNSAAIGPETAAQNSGMEILLKGIEDSPHNFTRFFIIGKEDAIPSGNDKTSVIFSAKNIPGSLYRVLEAFAVRDINLSKIESRPQRGKPWEYIFYLDFEGHRSEEKSKDAFQDIRKKSVFIKILGSYPKAAP